MIKCLYIAGQVWMFQADQAINLNRMSRVEMEDEYVMISGPQSGRTKIFTDDNAFDLFAKCEQQATQQLIFSAGMEMENEN